MTASDVPGKTVYTSRPLVWRTLVLQSGEDFSGATLLRGAGGTAEIRCCGRLRDAYLTEADCLRREMLPETGRFVGRRNADMAVGSKEAESGATTRDATRLDIASSFKLQAFPSQPPPPRPAAVSSNGFPIRLIFRDPS
jgi:hypothetical protein